jgi:hypothetical protein
MRPVKAPLLEITGPVMNQVVMGAAATLRDIARIATKSTRTGIRRVMRGALQTALLCRSHNLGPIRNHDHFEVRERGDYSLIVGELAIPN